ncbi:MAG TPA: BTAD domain-containing putative transcriptional regulator, partial [Ilumatobacter sp.]|nr:BTAD domain-containing putative transcriptional regulator [Ilumatobacter sp.]
MADELRTRTDGAALRLFGGVEVSGPLGVTSLTGAKQRALVARLAIDAGHAVSPEQLVDSVWGEHAPATVRASIQVHVSRVRKALAEIGLDDILVSRLGGYLLEVDQACIDVHRYEQLSGAATAAAQRGDHEQALDLALQALALWCGPPLAGVGDAPFVGPFTARLSGIRLELLAVAAAGSVAMRRVGDVLATVESLVLEHPYAEALWAGLARMLYAQGRQADALERLATVRRALREDLGLEPSLEITELERQILVHDPTLSPDATPSRTSAGATVGSNLPLLRSLIGRDALIADVARRLTQTSLVTLTGPGGVGKTSIAAHVAAQLGSSRRDGACFVDLTSVAPGQNPMPALTAAIGMVAPRALTIDDIVEVLAGRDQLVVFDNCEHV